MKRTLAIVCLVIATATFGLAAEPSGSVREVESLERQLVEAISKKDLATYDKIVADDYIVVEASGKDLTKAEIMASYRDGTRGYTNLEIYDVRTHVFGDTAVVSARTKGLRHEDGKDVVNDNRYIRVFARRDGRWRAVTQMSAPARP